MITEILHKEGKTQMSSLKKLDVFYQACTKDSFGKFKN